MLQSASKGPNYIKIIEIVDQRLVDQRLNNIKWANSHWLNLLNSLSIDIENYSYNNIDGKNLLPFAESSYVLLSKIYRMAIT